MQSTFVNWDFENIWDIEEGESYPYLRLESAPISCFGDLDGDGEVGINDFLILLANWGTSGPEGDIDGDGTVGINDFLALLGNWGPCDECEAADLNGDGVVDDSDLGIFQSYLDTYGFGECQTEDCPDINGDGDVNSIDQTLLLACFDEGEEAQAQQLNDEELKEISGALQSADPVASNEIVEVLRDQGYEIQVPDSLEEEKTWIDKFIGFINSLFG